MWLQHTPDLDETWFEEREVVVVDVYIAASPQRDSPVAPALEPGPVAVSVACGPDALENLLTAGIERRIDVDQVEDVAWQLPEQIQVVRPHNPSALRRREITRLTPTPCGDLTPPAPLSDTERGGR
jgi:hypothetical protein